MPFDPTLPANNAEILSAELRDQFNGLKAIIDAGNVPVGCVLAYLKTLSGIPALPNSWVECNGQVLSDAQSPLNGQTIPNLNGASGGTQRFLRGASASGGTGGTETHTHSYDVTDGAAAANDAGGSCFGFGVGDPRDTSSAETLPSYYQVVWVIRVK